MIEFAKGKWEEILLFANSIGAWFSMLSFVHEPLKTCLFVSPVLDMKLLISNMMRRANVSAAQLEQKLLISTSFGQTLSWAYWQYVLEHPIEEWKPPTKILYGEHDNLIDYDTVKQFTHKNNCHVTVMKNGEHWFHTKQQVEFMRDWCREVLSAHT